MKLLSRSQLKDFLEEKYKQYNRLNFIENDPVSIPHQFSKKQDIEIAGFLTATIAWGQRKTIIKNANELIRRMDHAPYDFILNSAVIDGRSFHDFVHRTFNGADCIFFLKSLQHIYKKYNSLEDTFKGQDVKSSILYFRKIFLSITHQTRSEKHISDPEANSACKRINMFLRWMVRKDQCGVDFGIWNAIGAHQLMCPLDVHSGNVARKLGLLNRKQNDWKAVAELTSRLTEFDRNDPVKYDFALFGAGVTGDV